MNYNYNR